MDASSAADASAGLRLRCPQCKQTYRVRNADSAKRYPCKKCNVPLEVFDDTVLAPGTPNVKPNSIAPTLLDARSANSPAPVSANSGSGMDLSIAALDRPAAPDATKDLSRLLPESFDGYRVIKELARGGMGAVLLGEQIDLRRKVAIKVILPWASENDQAQARFLREARAMAKLKHPHIIEVHQVGSVSSMTYLSMEFIEGETLSTLIHEKRLTFAQIAVITSKIARALAFAHSRGVIHRDIKPANIMVRANGEPVLMDFGLAKDTESQSVKLSMTGNVMGTPSYMSPEQAQGGQVNQRSDIYSLGAVLYEALTRQAPFEGETTIVTMYNVVHMQAKPAHEVDVNVPRSMSRICIKALEKDPDRRYGSMDEMAGDLDRFGEGMEITARGPGAGVRILDWLSTHKSAMTGMIVAIAAVLLLIAGLQMGWLRPGATKAAELRAALTSGSPKTRLLHVEALSADLHDGQIKKGTPEEAEALAALRLAVADSDPDVTIAACVALGDAQDKGAADAVAAKLAPEYTPKVRTAAIGALSAIDPPELHHLLMKIIRGDSSREVRLAAIEAIHDVAGPDVTIDLIRMAADSDPAIAAACQKKLSKLRPPNSIMAFYTGGNAAAVANATAQMLEKTNEMQHQAEDLLNDLDHPNSEPKKRLLPYEKASHNLQSGEAGQRVESAYDLGVLGDSRAEPVLVNALQDEDPDVALTAATALGKLKDLQLTDKIVGFLLHPKPSARQAAARVIALKRITNAGPALCTALLNEKQGAVQAEIAQTLGSLKHVGGVTPLIALLSQGTPNAVRRAAWALGQIGDKSACSPLVEALGRAGQDNELREEIAGALSALTGKSIGPNESQWREALK